ncbi:hypothetical protein GGH91_006413, partial [Coemansia sp. RSA 2671]
RKECDNNYMKAYDLSDMKSFPGHGLPDNDSPVFCSKMYDNTTECKIDSSISISNSGSGPSINSVDLNSTIFIIPRGSSVRVVSVGRPHLVEKASSASTPCNANGFIHFPRPGLYTDWIGWVTRGSIASNGSWVDKTSSGNPIEDIFDQNGAATSTPQLAALISVAVAALAIITTAF